MSEEIRDILESEETTGPVENPVETPDKENPDSPEVPADPSGEDEPAETPGEPDFSDEETITVADYLQGISELLSDKALRVILAKRKLKADTPVEELDEKERDLAEAEVYYQLSNLPVGGQQVKDVDGTWSHSEGGWTVSGANIAEWWRKYSYLRQKWGEQVLSRSTIRVHARGMRVWRRR